MEAKYLGKFYQWYLAVNGIEMGELYCLERQCEELEIDKMAVKQSSRTYRKGYFIRGKCQGKNTQVYFENLKVHQIVNKMREYVQRDFGENEVYLIDNKVRATEKNCNIHIEKNRKNILNKIAVIIEQFNDRIVEENIILEDVNVVMEKEKEFLYVPSMVKYELENEIILLMFTLKIQHECEEEIVQKLICITDYNELDEKNIVEQLCKKAFERKNLMSIQTGKYNVIIENQAMALMLASFQVIFNAEQNNNHQTILYNKFGKKICDSKISILNDYSSGVIRQKYDLEGVKTKTLELIKNGELVSFLYNQEWATKTNNVATGNAIRGTKGEIGIGSANLYIKNGDFTLEKMIECMQEGVVITDILDGYAGVDCGTGDYSVACIGNYVKDGIIVGALGEFILSGNILELLNSVKEVGNDLLFNYELGAYGSPSILFCPQVLVCNEFLTEKGE